MAPVDQRRYHRDDLRDMPGGPGFKVGRQHAEGRGVPVHFLDEAFGQRGDRFIILPGAGDDLVVNVGDISDIKHLQPPAFEITADHVEHDHDPRVADMAEIIDRHAADVHLDLAGDDGFERFLLPAQAVINF